MIGLNPAKHAAHELATGAAAAIELEEGAA